MSDGVTPAAGAVPARLTAPRRIGRYEVLFELARGGMGSVCVGRLLGAHGFDRFVAIKALPPASTAEAQRLFFDEAKVASRIHHPNVVSTLELFEHEGEPFIVMELVQGVSLARFIDRFTSGGGAMPAEVAAWIVMQAAAGLHAAHELRDRSGEPLGLVHRDVSPQNILLSHQGRVTVADLGIAKFRKEALTTDSGVVKGKFAYMSPEQASGKKLDRRSDLFSLGIVFHEMLTSRRLYAGASPAESVLSIVTGTVKDPRETRPAVPADMATIAMRCLEKSAEDRFQTADELRDALRQVLHAQSSKADEQRLSELLASSFGREAETFERRLAAAEERDEKESAVAEPTAPRRPVLGFVAPVVLVLAVAGGALYAVRGRAREPSGGAPAQAASHGESVGAEPREAPSAMPASSPSTALPTATPSSSASSPLQASPPPPRPRPVKPSPPRPAASPVPSVVETPAPAPPPSSQKGVIFKNF